MKNFINTLYEGLISWAEAIAEYRQSQASKHYYWGDHGLCINSTGRNRATNHKPYVAGTTMSYLDALFTLLRWKNQGWEVHPIVDTEFAGWI